MDLSAQMKRAARIPKKLLRVVTHSRPSAPHSVDDDDDDAEYVRLAYRLILRREADADGHKDFLRQLREGRISRNQFLDALVVSREFQENIQFCQMGASINASRSQFVRSLPKAARILDLGGTAQGSDFGAMYHLGYPYSYDELVIVDLPVADRHGLYNARKEIGGIRSPLGPVRYVYQSMTDLTNFSPDSFDLVYSGQSFEHVTEAEGDKVCQEVLRVLRPGGVFCLDTPNALATRMQQAHFIDPDHKIEYRHDQLLPKLEKAGFIVRESKGLNHLGKCLRTGVFDEVETSRNFGVYSDIENCYLLAYVCQKAGR